MQVLCETMEELMENVYATDLMIQDCMEGYYEVQINSYAFHDPEEYMEHIENTIEEATELRNELMRTIKEVEEKLADIMNDSPDATQDINGYLKQDMETTEDMELNHYGHATFVEIPVLMQEDECKLNVEKYLLKEKLHIYEDIGKYYNWSMLYMDVKTPVSKHRKMDRNKKLQNNELSYKNKAENGRFLYYEIVWIYNTKIKNFMIPRYNNVRVESKYGYG